MRQLITTFQTRLAVWLLLILCCLPLAGCWDQRELQDRHMVLAAAIDVADEPIGENETFVQPYGGQQFRLSMQMLNLEPSTEQQQTAAKAGTFIVSGVGRMLFEIVRDVLGQTSNSISWEHVQVIVISEAAIEAGGLDQLLDWFIRDAAMRWRIKLYITPGEAKSIIAYEPPSGEANGLFLAGILRNYAKNPHIAGSQTDLGFTASSLDNKQAVIMPKIELADNVIKVGGLAYIKNNRLAGYLNEYDTFGAKLFLGVEKSAVITSRCRDHPDNIYAFEVFQHDTRLQPHFEGDNLYYTLDITMYGNMNEKQRCPEPNDHDSSNPAYLRELEVQFAQEVKKAAEHALKVHQAMGIDGLKMGRRLRIYYPKQWEKLKDRWEDEVFPRIPVVISVNVIIRQVGEHK